MNDKFGKKGKGDYPMRQCILFRESEGGSVTYHCWIPEKFANEGKTISIKNHGSWLVQHVGQTTQSYKNLKERNKANRNYIRNTDI